MAMIAFKPATLVEAPEMKDLETMQTSSPQQGHGEVAPSKFTPGPWRAVDWCDRYPPGDDANEPSKRGEYFWIVFGGNSSELSGWISAADANLIAAAPDMLKMIRSYLATIERYPNMTRSHEIIESLHAGFRKVVRKATGEP